MHRTPNITAAVAAYNAEPWIAESIEAILGQTRPPDEVLVVDDGSTDGTPEILAGFGDAIRVVRRANGGCPAAFNTAFAAATGDYVAMCGSDDVWEPRKLEWQAQWLTESPQIDIAFGDAELFGLVEGTYARPPGEGILEPRAFCRALYRENMVCAPTVVVRRALFERLGPFVERFGADDYEYWMRALRAGAVFAFDPRVMIRYRRHEGNLSSRLRWMNECSHDVHRWYADLPGDDRLGNLVLARDLFRIGRCLVDEGRVAEARTAFRGALGYRLGIRSLAWTAVLALPPDARERTGSALIRLRRALAA